MELEIEVEYVIKGGYSIEGSQSLRSARRDFFETNYSNFSFGFRCTREHIEGVDIQIIRYHKGVTWYKTSEIGMFIDYWSD